MGNKGDLRAGDVQWMTAGRGIIHSEMPQQLEGRMRGFQLWLNLPAAEKMKPANYRDIPAAQIPTVGLDNDVSIKVIAGPLTHNGETTEGAISGVSTQPIYWDVSLPANTRITLPVPEQHQLFVYLYEGELTLGDAQRRLDTSQAGILTPGDTLTLQSKAQPSRVLVIGGKAIGEPIAQYGPFVMNTSDEIEQAINDYRSGQLAG